MKRLTVNGFAMPFIDIGDGQPIVCIHGSLSDFRTWGPVMGPLSAKNRLIVPSLRHFFPDRCEGEPATYNMAQHVADTIAFLEALAAGPVDLIGHSRGGHLAFRVAQQRPDLIRKLVLAEPGGTLDASLMPAGAGGGAPAAGSPAHVAAAAEKIRSGDLNGGLRAFKEGIDGPGSWDALPPADQQMRRDNGYTLLAQLNEGRQPYTRAEAAALTNAPLMVGGENTPGMLPVILKALAATIPGAETAMIPNAGHSMFTQNPTAFCEAVLDFLGR